MDFKAKYNRNAFVDFFSTSLLPEDFETATEIVEPDFKSKYYQSITYLGQSPSLDLNIYEIRHSSERDARVGLSRDAFKLVSRYGANNALILFVPENPDNFRLSLVTIEPKLDAKGVKILKEYSNPRRYSFVLGDDAKIHTPEQYLIALGRISDNADLTKRFSVEVVNKEFYGQIAEMFSKLVGGQRKKGNRTVDYLRQLVLPSVTADHDQKYKEFAVRLIGRTVFCWFLKKKKSDKGVPLIHNDVLSRFAADFTPNFYHARVEPLFFEVLNTSIEKRNPEYKKDPFDKIPFLNGGLFEPHLDDFYKVNKVTGTSEYLNTLKIPDDWWKELLDILETYNFTIDENTSIDIDLSVDPEMLGRIFENLLAEINPETGDTARKATGSYYTPRPIVEYMVDQSLKQYLVTKTALDETKFDTLLDYSNEASGLSEAEEKTVIEALNTIKILDPACGSGAFPMGMLQKMLLILQKVDHNAQNSVQQILNEIVDPIKRELIKRKLEAAQVLDDVDFDDYARKLNVIQRSIYGVDIQPIATDISKLRFFLSLVVDEVIQDEAPNRGIEPLPNLEFKFVCSNTLIPLPEADNFERMFGDAELVSGLENIRTRYFTASNDDKPALKKEFEGLQKKLYDFISQNKDILSNPNGRLAMLAAWKPFSDEAATWFDPKWMFGVDSGFDVVIGNPPYIRVEYISETQVKYFKETYKSSTGKFDISFLFIEKGLNILKPNSILIFISTYQFIYSGAGIGLRKFIASNSITNIEMFSSESQVFENATTYTGIIKCVKTKQNTKQSIIKALYINNQIIKKEKIELSYENFISNKVIVAETSLIDKIFQNRYIIFGSTIGYSKCGIVSSADEVYFIKLENINDIKIEKELIYPILGSESLERWNLKKPTYYCIYPYEIEGNDTVLISELKLKSKFPFTYKHFKNFEHILRNRSQGRKSYEQSDKWYQLNRPREKWIYESKKIIYPGTTNEPRFALDSEGVVFRNARLYAFILKDIDISVYKYLICILNSKLCSYLISIKCPPKDSNYFEMSTNFLDEFPFMIKKDKIKIFNILYDRIVSNIVKSEKNESFDNINNLMVYKLYELTYDEVKIVDPEIENLISSEDYERLDIEGLAKYKIL